MATYNTLNALFSAIADKIRAKKGTTEPIVADNFPEEINNIEDIFVNYAKSSSGVFNGADFSAMANDTIYLDFKNDITSANSMFRSSNCSTLKKMHIKFGNGLTSIDHIFSSARLPEELVVDWGNSNPTEGSYYFYANSNENTCKKITIIGSTSAIKNWGYAFRMLEKLDEIDADLDFSGSTNTTIVAFYQCWNLKHIRIVRNSIKKSLSVNSNGQSTMPLTDETLVFFANGFDNSVAPKTFTVTASQKTQMNNIMGTVEHIVEADIEYDFFTLDESGTVSLTEFITDYKGWTIA